jgi:uncharacterized protein (DUF1778 family)
MTITRHSDHEQPGATTRKDERLEARVTAQQKEMFQRAAMLKGQSLSEFMVSSAQSAAEHTIREHEVLTLTARDSRVFVEALLAPPSPNPRLQAAAERYKRTVKEL